ncbi:MAG: hypothetical protein BWY11_00992 [Firmicutes bacterium ADurb.Bin182]|nr:MAG: hypothetical protein BWY11_00992 [Firmicutes bacterium ADurb.Bin182]
MTVASVQIKLYAPWVHSLKEKRSLVKSLLAKVKSKFNVSAAEVGEQDVHQTAVMGFAVVSGSVQLANSTLDTVVQFIEDNTEAEIIEVIRRTD